MGSSRRDRSVSHYPTTAELASFRRSIAGSQTALLHPEGVYAGVVEAWPDEIRDGIGLRMNGRAPYLSAVLLPYGKLASMTAREQASAMRSRAYARLQEYAGDLCARCGLARSEHIDLDARAPFCSEDERDERTFEQL